MHSRNHTGSPGSTKSPSVNATFLGYVSCAGNALEAKTLPRTNQDGRSNRSSDMKNAIDKLNEEWRQYIGPGRPTNYELKGKIQPDTRINSSSTNSHHKQPHLPFHKHTLSSHCHSAALPSLLCPPPSSPTSPSLYLSSPPAPSHAMNKIQTQSSSQQQAQT